MNMGKSVVYMTKEITPESLIKIYEKLGKPVTGRVGVKISTGELGGHNYLKPELIGKLVKLVNGTIIECNTAYEGSRNSTEAHKDTIRQHGFYDIADVDIMDEEGDFQIPVRDTKHIKYDIVGTHLKNYDFIINLAHFKGHLMAGLGGVLKNQSIGVASAAGKAYIHSAGLTSDVMECWNHVDDQDGFLESMAAAAQGVHDYMKGNIVYIDVLNNISIDCDCDSNPHDPTIEDIGILASLDPVAVDQASVDLIWQVHHDEHNDAEPLKERIEQRHGKHTIDYAAKLGFGSQDYELVSID